MRLKFSSLALQLLGSSFVVGLNFTANFISQQEKQNRAPFSYMDKALLSLFGAGLSALCSGAIVGASVLISYGFNQLNDKLRYSIDGMLMLGTFGFMQSVVNRLTIATTAMFAVRAFTYVVGGAHNFEPDQPVAANNLQLVPYQPPIYPIAEPGAHAARVRGEQAAGQDPAARQRL